jgi:hypothetical protein
MSYISLILSELSETWLRISALLSSFHGAAFFLLLAVETLVRPLNDVVLLWLAAIILHYALH